MRDILKAISGGAKYESKEGVELDAQGFYEKGGSYNPYAVCTTSIGKTARHTKKK